MPSNTQIIPTYAHPHIETFINDNTTFTPEVTSPEEGVRGIYVFTSGKGRDNVILPFEQYQECLNEYGAPDFNLYGQPGYMPIAALATGQAKAWCMRVMPTDAAYSNAVIVAKVKIDNTDEENPKMVIKHEVVFHSGLTTKTEFSSLTDILTEEDPDGDGFMTFPLFGLYSLGRGTYGNTLRFRVVPSVSDDQNNGFRNYRFEIYTTEGGLTRLEVFYGSFAPNAVNESGTTIYLEDVINESDVGSRKVNLYVCQDSFEKIYDLYKSDIAPTSEINLQTFDLFTGLDINSNVITDLEIDNTETTTVSIDGAGGVSMAGGTEGSFTIDKTNPELREAAIEDAYVKAFSGVTDASILSKRRVPAEVIFDANYTLEVKKALIALLIKRYDAFGYIDAGILNTPTDATDWGESMSAYADRIFSKQFQHYYIKDPFSGKNIPMTVTYFLVNKVITHFKSVGGGNHIPFVGEAYAKLTGAIKDSLKPMIDADNNEVKEALYNLRLNYFECIAENTYTRGTQSTSQNIWSDLSEENNMLVLLELKRKLEKVVASKSYNFAEKEDRQKFTEAAERLITPYIGVKMRAGSVFFNMNSYEELRNILHCYLNITFKSLVKTGIIEIDINRRA